MENKLQHQYHNVKAFSEQSKQFKPAKQDEPKCYNIWLNSQNKVSGTNNDCMFNIKLPDDFTSDRLGVCMTNFIPSYPMGTDEGIVQVNLAGLDNRFSYSSSNQNTHKVLGMFPLNDGLNKVYPPANMTANTTANTTFSNLPYGNGTYIASGPNRDPPWRTFDGDSNTTANYWGGAYGVHPNASNNTNTGAYNQSISTTMSGSNYLGSTWNIQLPSKVIPTSYRIQHSIDNNKQVTEWVMGGSSNGSSWELLDYSTQSNWAGYGITDRVVNSSNAYDYYRIVALTVGWSTGTPPAARDIPQIAEWRIFGNNNPQVTRSAIRQYPPTFLSSNITTLSNQAYGNDSWIVTESSTVAGSSGAWSIFDASETDGWTCSNSKYDRNTNGNHLGTEVTVASGSNFNGEWFQIEAPRPFVLTNYSLRSRHDGSGRNPRDFIVVGSMNGTTWTKLAEWYDQSLLLSAFNTVFPFNIPTPAEFKFYRFIVPQIQGPLGTQSGSAWLSINSMRLFGYKLTPPSRVGQVNLNNEIVTCDNSLFKRETRVTLTSPTGLDLSTMCNWSMSLNIYENPN